ncbi:MAG TPA: hypothetical protein VFA03_07370 [Acetobacteraceae bacterium]|nr:hypothetical protein [Acetobacteraceae bacterium]
MSDEIEKTEGTPSRRDFVKKSAQVAVTAPAVGMLLSASTKPALALNLNPYTLHILDDFSFGNDREDIDAIALGSNFNPLDGQPQKDDHI